MRVRPGRGAAEDLPPGDELIARYPTLSWQRKRGDDQDAHHHFTVLTGYSRAHKDYSAELVCTHLQDLEGELRGDAHRARWKGMVELAEQFA